MACLSNPVKVSCEFKLGLARTRSALEFPAMEAKKVKRKFVWNLSSALLAALVLSVGSAKAQTIAYRQTNLSSDVPGTANHTDLALRNPWGVAFYNNGRVISQDASGAFTAPGGFIIPNLSVANY